ncbi:MAG: ATP-binding cassette domain-containing protein [Oscillospiraceae bacterium]|nr:ATP-binding cassette domain-containing protein [Oscillospiraceae bacterium]
MGLYVDIKKNLGNFSLEVSFEAERETFGILGASGSGKSMTLKCIAGIEKPDSGEIVFDGKIFYSSKKKINLPSRERHTGYLFQNYALFPNMTVEENIASGICGSRTEKATLAGEKIKTFRLEGLEKKYPFEISGGQQQRVALARIFASKPEILMLDEPFSALDSYLKWTLEQEIVEVLQNFKGPAFLVSHNRDEAYRLCGRMAVISEGKIDMLDDKHGIFENPQKLSAAQLTGCKNISAAKKISDNEIFALDWEMPLKCAGKVGKNISHVGIRGNYFEVCADLSEENAFEYEIFQKIEDTFSVILMIKKKDANPEKLIRCEVCDKKWKEIKEGKKYLKISPQKIFLLEA